MLGKTLFKIYFRRRRILKRSHIKKRRKIRQNSGVEYMTHRAQALLLVQSRLEYFNQFYDFKYNKITIRNQISRWGSCSKRGNLNFNYRIALLSPELADYIIVHELCHLGEFNHSKAFWILVERTVPNWKELRVKLKEWKINT